MTEEEKGFILKDNETVSDGSGSGAKEGSAATKKTGADTASDQITQLPAINFLTFLISLNSSALVHLGEIEDPTSGQKTKNLPLAKQTIDVLGMLDEKTRGNQTDEEENMLKHILHDLKLKYIQAK
jgi:hypothetical protein